MATLHSRRRGAHVYRLVYASYARRPISNADRSQIAESSARNNARDGVSGMLIECADEFIQVLEGEMRAVKRVFTRLAEDERHANVSILTTQTSAPRRFSDWSMGCFHVAPDLLPKGFFSNDRTAVRLLRGDASKRVDAFLSDFYQRHHALGMTGAYAAISDPAAASGM